MKVNTIECREQKWQSYLVCCTAVITNEIKQGLTQKQISLTYAMAILSDHAGADKPDWPLVNQAIVGKWGQKGLDRVKRLAWQLIDDKKKKYMQSNIDHH